jgi:hypothetical protein
MTPPRRIALPLLVATALALAALALAACGSEEESKDVVEGQPVELGELKYNVTFSRFLNPDDNEDSAYLAGQKEAPPGSAYFGVFLEVQNESEEEQELADSFTITDADHETFEVVESESLYAFPLGGTVESQEQIPILDSTAQQGSIEGSLALFELPDSASENRPLILSIPGEDGPATVTLDL